MVQKMFALQIGQKQVKIDKFTKKETRVQQTAWKNGFFARVKHVTNQNGLFTFVFMFFFRCLQTQSTKIQCRIIIIKHK